ncbi:hypothetical protein ACEPPN_010458 [Leptodophora sp. 'Broadleaf-Isolate-01']
MDRSWYDFCLTGHEASETMRPGKLPAAPDTTVAASETLASPALGGSRTISIRAVKVMFVLDMIQGGEEGFWLHTQSQLTSQSCALSALEKIAAVDGDTYHLDCDVGDSDAPSNLSPISYCAHLQSGRGSNV